MKRDEAGLDAANFWDVKSVTQFQMAAVWFGVSGKAGTGMWVTKDLYLFLLE